MTLRITERPWIDPLNAFWSIRDLPNVAFLDSSLRGHTDSKWTYLCVDPALILTDHKDGTKRKPRGGQWETVHDWRETFRQIPKNHISSIPRDAPPFCGGWIGWLGYEFGAQFDDIAVKDEDVLGAPLLHFAFYDTVLAFDLDERRAWLCDCSEDYPNVLRDIQSAAIPSLKRHRTEFVSNFTKSDYEASVKQAIKYIRAGDVYQINLSQQFTGEAPAESPAIYAGLRQLSPAPYSAFLRSDYGTLISSSPELFFDINQTTQTITCRPIKGTRSRGFAHQHSVEGARELSQSSKDRAENIMIVDLVRNDLGRVCEPGSVVTLEICRREIHPTVIHLVSTVQGRLRTSIDPIGVFEALFPGGSVTGAPKIRACEIIKSLESSARGLYTGAYGFVSITGATKLAMSIRVIWSNDSLITYNVGGGIVADSDPEQEYHETLVKAAAIQGALTA